MADPGAVFADDEAEKAANARAEADLAAGRIVPHAEVAHWLRSWGKLDELPCPTPDSV